jgi:hypothetical protein
MIGCLWVKATATIALQVCVTSHHLRSSTSRNRSRVKGDKSPEDTEPRSYFPDDSVDPTDARNDILGCFGRSHRSAQWRWLWTGQLRRPPWWKSRWSVE